MRDLYFTSVLSVEYRAELERLIFFNPEQGRSLPHIVRSIVRFGQPEIRVCEGSLRIAVGKCAEVQSLHALATGLPRPQLAGTVVYVRESLDDLVVIHIAAAPDYAASRGSDDVPVAIRLLNEVMLVARRIKGVKFVELPYAGSRRGRVSVDSGPFLAG